MLRLYQQLVLRAAQFPPGQPSTKRGLERVIPCQVAVELEPESPGGLIQQDSNIRHIFQPLGMLRDEELRTELLRSREWGADGGD
ncbi:hypothetical protein D3C86_1794910 [compost metagenome]